MKKIITIAFISTILFYGCVNQIKKTKVTLPIPTDKPIDNWQRVNISNVGLIDMPT